MSRNSFEHNLDNTIAEAPSATVSNIHNNLFYFMSHYNRNSREEKNSLMSSSASSVKNLQYVDLNSLHGMVLRFLVEKRMSKKELAQVLNISVRNLERLFSEEIPPGLLSKINLPLVKLYCSTKW
ncbi:MAG: hypothetical protein KKE11_05535 [Gammaproteobacteria bacterium]|nr:hypothetical protein [Gammaproteobacteria bacterium]